MIPNPPHDATGLLDRIALGDAAAADHLLPLLYAELHGLAEQCFRRERADHTLQPTALVNEAYLRLITQPQMRFKDRAHFIGVAARAMRQVLIDHARIHNASKRGGGRLQITLDQAVTPIAGQELDVLALHEALERLAVHDERKSRVVELRFFGGLSIEETAEVLDVARTTVTEDWRMARAWLARELCKGAAS